jgi:single-strand DNA-binding protein
MSVNKVILVGNLTRDPEFRSTASGTSVLSMRLAFSRRAKNPASGAWEDVPNYIDAAVFGGRAESLRNILKKGSHIAVDGKLRWREWESAGGDKRQAIDILADDIILMGGRDAGAQTGGQTAEPPVGADAQPDAQPSGPPDELNGEEIPF